jgi:UDP-N-acetylglucosamine 1-carboxyvinyltransferase
MNSDTTATFHIQGSTPLHGSVRVGGAKNAAYKLMIASLLASSESRLLNLPDIADVDMVKKNINELGARAL